MTNETGKTLAEILERRGLSQRRLATQTGVSQPYVNRIVSGQRKPNADWLEIVTMALALSPDESRKLKRAAIRDRGFRIDLG